MKTSEPDEEDGEDTMRTLSESQDCDENPVKQIQVDSKEL